MQSYQTDIHPDLMRIVIWQMNGGINFKKLTPKKQNTAKKIIALNKFGCGDYKCSDKAVLEVLEYYKIKR